ncbi:hypothetical protein [Maridesulfovibrio sp.]|uniref:hypothetical protein n=1 Tax=Maridesulfovibrio sp. TaxID=2795000 RepID=UPI003BACFBB6
MADNDYSYDAPSIDSTPGGDSVKSSILEKNQARVEQALVHLNTHKNRTDSHGTNSPIVGTDDEQTLTNKTLFDPVITYSGDPDQNSPVTREWVEGQSDLAVNQARTARDEAVQARDEAVAAKDIAVDAAKTLKITPEPVLVGDASGNEGEELVFTVTNHKAGVEYQVSVTGGTVSVTNGTITWILPNVDVDTDYTLTAYASKLGFQQSSAVLKTVSVKDVPIQDGPTMAFADNVEGYPGATVVDGIISAPAHSVGLTNTDQLVSAKPEIMVPSGRLNLLEGTSKSVLKLAAKVTAGDVIITDQGECMVASVDQSTTNQEFIPVEDANGAVVYNSTYNSINISTTLPTGRLTKLGLKSGGAYTSSRNLGVFRKDSATTYTMVATSPLSSLSVGMNWVDIDYIVPDTGEYYIGVWGSGSETVAINNVDYQNAVYSATPSLGVAVATQPDPGFGAPVVGYASDSGVLHSATLAQPLSGVPTKAFKDPLKSKLTLISATTTSITTAEKVTEGETLFVRLSGVWNEVTAGTVTKNDNRVNKIASDLTFFATGYAKFSLSGTTIKDVSSLNSHMRSPINSDHKELRAKMGNAQSIGLSFYTANASFASGGGALPDGEAAKIGSIIFAPGYDTHAFGYRLFDADPVKLTYNAASQYGLRRTGDSVDVLVDGVVIDSYAIQSSLELGMCVGGPGSCPDYTDCVVLEGPVSSVTDLTAANLSSTPTAVAKPSDFSLKLGAGATGEYLGPREGLTLAVSNPGSNIIPAMTAETTGGWTISANEDGSGAWPGWKVADGRNDSGQWLAYNGNNAPSIPVLNIKAPSAQGTSRLRLRPYVTNISFVPKDFTLKARLEGGEWVTLLDVVGADYIKNYPSSNDYWGEWDFPAGNYDEFSLRVTKDNRGYQNACLTGFELLEAGEVLSSATSIVVTSAETVKEQILKPSGLHNKIEISGQLVEINSVAEEVETTQVAGEPLIPVMTSNTQDGITVSASNSSAPYPPYKSTASSVGSTGWIPDNPAPQDWFIEFPAPVRLAKYALTAPSNDTNAKYYHPKTWEITGLGTDGVTWEAVDNKADQPNWTPSEKREYSISPAQSYAKYRVRCSNNQAGDNQIGIGKIQMWPKADKATYTTTINLKTALPAAPTIDTVVAIPDRCTLAPASYTCDLNGDDLKITGAEIALEDNPALKRLAMAVSGDDLTFKGGKIYTKEKL